jgi:hypothetical protein
VRTVKKYCDGKSAECMGSTDNPAWQLHEECQDDQACDSDGDTFATCITCEHICYQGSCTVGFSQITAGRIHNCGLKNDGSISCWGANQLGQSTPPAGTDFVYLGASNNHTCALKKDSSAICWGLNDFGQLDVPTGKSYVAITCGGQHTCGLMSDGVLNCWGAGTDPAQTGSTPHYGQSLPPRALFFKADAGLYHTCGTTQDNKVVGCWGLDDDGQSSSSIDTALEEVSAGDLHSCGINSDGVATCWGAGTINSGSTPNFGQSIPPTGVVIKQISAGGFHTCGLTNDATVVCWGKNQNGQSTPPSDTDFTAVTSGGEHTCALKSDGSIKCWGLDNYGQITPPAP